MRRCHEKFCPLVSPTVRKGPTSRSRPSGWRPPVFGIDLTSGAPRHQSAVGSRRTSAARKTGETAGTSVFRDPLQAPGAALLSPSFREGSSPKAGTAWPGALAEKPVRLLTWSVRLRMILRISTKGLCLIREKPPTRVLYPVTADDGETSDQACET
jgi:hypothetical protein